MCVTSAGGLAPTPRVTYRPHARLRRRRTEPSLQPSLSSRPRWAAGPVSDAGHVPAGSRRPEDRFPPDTAALPLAPSTGRPRPEHGCRCTRTPSRPAQGAARRRRATDGDLICCLEDGRRSTRRRARNASNGMCAGSVSPASGSTALRQTHATLALRTGVHHRVVQERLGHADVSITLDTYSHVDLDMQAIAAARVAALVTGNAE